MHRCIDNRCGALLSLGYVSTPYRGSLQNRDGRSRHRPPDRREPAHRQPSAPWSHPRPKAQRWRRAAQAPPRPNLKRTARRVNPVGYRDAFQLPASPCSTWSLEPADCSAFLALVRTLHRLQPWLSARPERALAALGRKLAGTFDETGHLFVVEEFSAAAQGKLKEPKRRFVLRIQKPTDRLREILAAAAAAEPDLARLGVWSDFSLGIGAWHGTQYPPWQRYAQRQI